MDINIQAEIGLCTEYMGADGKKVENGVSIVIAPLKVTAEDAESRIRVVMGCNMWRACHNHDCWYSIAARDRSSDRA